MLATISNSIDSNQRLNSYAGRAIGVPHLPFYSRKDRRKAQRIASSRKKIVQELARFKAGAVAFLSSSEDMLEVIEHFTYVDLEGIEQLAQEAVQVTGFRKNMLSQFKEVIDEAIFNELVEILLNLSETNKEINKIAKELILAHNIDGALERGYLVVSDLACDDYTVDINLRIYLSKEDGEFKAVVEPLEIVEYGDSLSEVIANTKEYIIDLYEELSSTDANNLSSGLKAQKEFLMSSVTKEGMD